MLDIRVENLHKEFGSDVVAVDNLTMTFPAGTTTCLLGPSGCGKTTLMRIIAGLERPTRGDVYFGDERVTNFTTHNRNIGMVFQYPVVYRGISVRQNIELPLRREKLSKAERDKRVDEVIELLEMGDSIHKNMNELDNGTRQKVAVARTLARHPRIILFDEPITNVDINAKLQLKRALKELILRLNQTIIYVTHDQTEAMTLADKIALMRDGAIVQYAAPRELYNYPDDAFGAWFLGNPGMNFFEHIFDDANGTATVQTPLFPSPIRLRDVGATKQQITLGIRPEQVRISLEQAPAYVPGVVQDKVVVTGGQYLLSLEAGGQTLKVKAPAQIGRHVEEVVWMKLPLDRMHIFVQGRRQPDARLELVNA